MAWAEEEVLVKQFKGRWSNLFIVINTQLLDRCNSPCAFPRTYLSGLHQNGSFSPSVPGRGSKWRVLAHAQCSLLPKLLLSS